MSLTNAQRYVLANAAEGGGCWLWELGAATTSHLDDRDLHWNGFPFDAAQQAALDLYRAGLAVVTAERVDDSQRYTGETWTVDEDAAFRALSDPTNWLEPLTAPSRGAVYSLAATSAGEAALAAEDGPAPDEVRSTRGTRT